MTECQDIALTLFGLASAVAVIMVIRGLVGGEPVKRQSPVDRGDVH